MTNTELCLIDWLELKWSKLTNEPKVSKELKVARVSRQQLMINSLSSLFEY